MNNTQEIKEIVNNKIESMLQDGVIEKQITDAVEKNVLSAINSAIDHYEIKGIIKDKLQSEISTELKDLSFSAYTSKIIESVCAIIDHEKCKDLTDKVRAFYKDLFEEPKETITVQKIIDKYVEYMTSKKDDDYESIPNYAKITIETRGYYSKYYNVKLAVPTNNYSDSLYSSTKTNEKNEYYYEFCVSTDNERSGNIFSMHGGEDRQSLNNQFSYRYYSEFEIFLLNLYLNRTKVIISDDDLCEDEEYALGDY